MKLIILLMCLFQIFFISNCSKRKDEVREKNTTGTKVKVISPKDIALDDKLNGLGNIVPFKEVSISAEVIGKMEKIYVVEGVKVHYGQTLARIDEQPFQLAIKKAESALSQAKSNMYHAESTYKEALLVIEKKFFEIEKMAIQLRQTDLELKEKERDYSNKKILLEKEGISQVAFKKIELEFEEAKSKYLLVQKNYETEMIGFRDSDIKKDFGSIPEKKDEKVDKIKQMRTRTEKAKYDIAESEFYKAKIGLEEAKIMLGKCTIKSSLDGVVGVKNINEGEQVKTETPLFVIFETKNVYGEFEINEEDLFKIGKGINVEIKADAYPEKIFKGKVDVISPLVSQKTRTTIIKVLLANKGEKLKPGMFIRGIFKPKKKRNVLVIQEKAIHNLKGDKADVYIVKDDYVAKRSILVESEKNDDFYIIREGISPQEIIVLESEGVLSEGEKIVIE